MADVVRRAAEATFRSGTMRRFVLLCVGALSVLPPLFAHAQDDAATLERKVKAAFLYKFAGYVEWPASTFAAADTPIVIGVVGDDPLVAELMEVVSGRAIEGRPLAVKRLRETDALSGLQMLFVGSTERAPLGTLARAMPALPMLIVTEFDGAFNHGSAINFLISGGRVRFEIALDNAEKRGLKLSSRLLSVAQAVRTGAAP